MKPLIIIKVGDSLPKLLPALGDFEHWVMAGLDHPELPIQVLDPRRGDVLPHVDSIAGAIVTGSHAMVTDRLDWSEATASWLAGLVEHDVPLLGICYGHQLLAHALGGAVGFHPGGMEIGTKTVCLVESAVDDVLLGAMPSQFSAHTVHAQSVLRLPAQAVLLAGNDYEQHHAFRVGASAWGVQFHPEFGSVAMRGYLRHLEADVQKQGGDVDGLLEQVCDTPVSAALLRRFAEIVQARIATSRALG